MEKVVLIAYSGHAYVVADCLQSANVSIKGYMDVAEKVNNPYSLPYLGSERDVASLKSGFSAEDRFFVAVGDNALRKKISQQLYSQQLKATNAIHHSAIISQKAMLKEGVLCAPGSIVNAMAEIGEGVIVNSNVVVEHECKISAFVHLAPGAILCGNVTVGENSFIGARAVVKQGVTIGKNCTIGAGAVVLCDVEDGKTVYGNPAKEQVV